MRCPECQSSFEVRGEFAALSVALDEDANGPRLRLTDLNSRATVFVDALLLAGLMKAAGDPEAICVGLLPTQGH